MNTSSMRAGWSQVEYTPAPGLNLMGQMRPRIATHARDPLMAVAVAFESGQTRAVLVACDICALDNEFTGKTQQAWLHDATLLIHATHSHVAPVATNALGEIPSPEFQEKLRGAILEAANQALDNLEPVKVFAANGFLEQMGWNRRAMFADGTSKMHGNSTQPGFCGLEGPRDGHLPVLWTKNARGVLTGVLTGFATHPNCVEGGLFYSADLPGAVRQHLSSAFDGAQVIYLTGAAGNTAHIILDPYEESRSWSGEAGLEKSADYLAGAVAQIISENHEPMTDDVLAVQHQKLEIGVRAWPEPGETTYPAWPGIDYYDKAAARWPQHLQENNPFPVNLHVLRIGDAVICTNPAELFVEFGLEIKADSPARVTFVSELTDGYCGYVPTAKAFARGGYETWCAPSSHLAFEAGDQIVASTKQLLKNAFD